MHFGFVFFYLKLVSKIMNYSREADRKYYVAVPWGKTSFGICWWSDTHTFPHIQHVICLISFFWMKVWKMMVLYTHPHTYNNSYRNMFETENVFILNEMWWSDTHTTYLKHIQHTIKLKTVICLDFKIVEEEFHNFSFVLTLFNNLFISWQFVEMLWLLHI